MSSWLPQLQAPAGFWLALWRAVGALALSTWLPQFEMLASLPGRSAWKPGACKHLAASAPCACKPLARWVARCLQAPGCPSSRCVCATSTGKPGACKHLATSASYAFKLPMHSGELGACKHLAKFSTQLHVPASCPFILGSQVPASTWLPQLQAPAGF